MECRKHQAQIMGTEKLTRTPNIYKDLVIMLVPANWRKIDLKYKYVIFLLFMAFAYMIYMYPCALFSQVINFFLSFSFFRFF